jgi:subtilisin family serine protease
MAHQPLVPSRGRSLANLRLAALAIGALACLTAPAAAAGSASAEGPAAGSGTARVLVRLQRPHLGLGREGALAERFGGELRHDLGNFGIAALEIPADQLDALRADPAVAIVEPDFERFTFKKGGGGGEIAPSMGNGLYGLILTRSMEAHSRKVLGRGVRLCSVDTGIDAKHPDIAPRYRGGIDTRDDDGNPDVGTNASEGMHGTMVAGVLAGALDGKGIRGVAYEAELYHARVLGTSSGSSSDIMAGVAHLVEARGCRVVNMSLGGPQHSQVEEDFYRDLAERYDVLIVAAAGNEGTQAPSYPAGYPTVLAVSAIDSGLALADFSSHGNWISVTGPGVGVLSSAPRGSGREGYVQVSKKVRIGGVPMAFSGLGSPNGRVVDCGDGNEPEDFPASVRRGIALIRRGPRVVGGPSYTFASKVENAMAAGALGAIVYNDEPGGFGGTLTSARTSTGAAWIPVLAVSAEDGERLLAGGTMQLALLATDLGTANGTSFSSPYVAGVAALVRAVAPHLSRIEVREVLESTAQDIGEPGFDSSFGWGLVDADAATREAAQR